MNDDFDDFPGTVGVYLTPGMVKQHEDKMRKRIHDLRISVESAAVAIIWAKSRDPAFAAAETKLLEAMRTLRETDTLLTPSE